MFLVAAGTMAILLSIIIPAYNVQAYLGPCMAAIFAQLQAHHELIVIDDGSLDATATVLAQCKQEHGASHFTVAWQANGGVAAARNHGLALARGEYIAFVDSDDLLLPGALQAIDEVIARHQPDVISCDLRLWYPDRPGKTRIVRAGYAPHVLTVDRDTILSVYFHERQMYVWSKIFKRTIYERQTAPLFPPGRVFEDVTAVPLLLAGCDNLYYLPHCIIDYRQRPGSISKTMSAQACLDLATALLPARARLATLELTSATRMQFDVAASHFYLGVVKDSYLLPWATGRAVRRQAKGDYLASLFHDHALVLDAMARPDACVGAARCGPRWRRQITAALAGSLHFEVAQLVAGRLRRWRDRRRQ